jgi:DNA-binding LacI/PurR family transcriptional regulator
MSKLTLDEIAALAGVSRSTVSRALNNQPRVSAEVRKRVQHIMASTGYAPNVAAQSLAQQRRLPLIAVVINEPTVTVFSDPELGRIMADVSAACLSNHCLCALYLLNGVEQLPVLQPPHIAGAIAVGAQSARIVSELHARRLPVIVLDRNTVPDRTDLAYAIRQFLQPRTASST